MDTTKILIKLAAYWILAFIFITIVVAFAYLHQFKQAKKFDELKELLQSREGFQNWKDENRLLVKAEQITYSMWIFSIFSTFVIPMIFESKVDMLRSTFLTILLLLSIANIIIKRILYFKMTNFLDKSND